MVIDFMFGLLLMVCEPLPLILNGFPCDQHTDGAVVCHLTALFHRSEVCLQCLGQCRRRNFILPKELV
jgi:hypothetical protein